MQSASSGVQHSFSHMSLQDKKKQTVVNNDSGDIMEMLNSELDELCTHSSCPDLFPKHLQAEITDLNDYLSDTINTGVYKCGFAESQVFCWHARPTSPCAAADADTATVWCLPRLLLKVYTHEQSSDYTCSPA